MQVGVEAFLGERRWRQAGVRHLALAYAELEVVGQGQAEVSAGLRQLRREKRQHSSKVQRCGEMAPERRQAVGTHHYGWQEKMADTLAKEKSWQQNPMQQIMRENHTAQGPLMFVKSNDIVHPHNSQGLKLGGTHLHPQSVLVVHLPSERYARGVYRCIAVLL